MLTEALIEAYRATDYVLFDSAAADITLNIGRRSAAFDEVLARRGVETAVIVTAYNPRSIVLPEAENRDRHAALVAMIEAKGYAHALGEGRDPTGDWKAELECVVFGISVQQGIALARAFEQNAIVFIARGDVPMLVYPDAPPLR
jgi:hypothetical protein